MTELFLIYIEHCVIVFTMLEIALKFRTDNAIIRNKSKYICREIFFLLCLGRCELKRLFRTYSIV